MSQERYTVSAVFDNVHRMKPGTPVSHLGIDVGTLEELTPVRNRVRLTVAVRAEHRIPEGATLTIRPTGILGDYYLEFQGGDPAQGYLATDGTAEVAGIPMITVDDIVSKLVDFTAKLEGHLDTLGGNLAALSANLNALIGDETLQKNVRDTAAEMPETVRAYRDLAVRAARAADETKAAAGRIRTLAENLDKQVEVQGENMDQLTRELATTAETLNKTLASLDEILKRIRAGKGTVGRLVEEDELQEKLVTSVERMNEALTAIKEMSEAIRKRWGGGN
jgi:phospholipid/cholesterol/gamma-HCH transport system substrate-binding protein